MASTSAFTITLKRGDDFSYTVTAASPTDPSVPVDFSDPATFTLEDVTNWTIRAQLRLGEDLAADMTVTKDGSDTSKFTLAIDAATTEGFELGTHQADIEITRAGVGRKSSDTFSVEVCEDVTRD